MKKKGIGSALTSAHFELRKKKRTVAAVYILLRFSVLLIMVAQFSTGTLKTCFFAC